MTKAKCVCKISDSARLFGLGLTVWARLLNRGHLSVAWFVGVSSRTGDPRMAKQQSKCTHMNVMSVDAILPAKLFTKSLSKASDCCKVAHVLLFTAREMAGAKLGRFSTGSGKTAAGSI